MQHNRGYIDSIIILTSQIEIPRKDQFIQFQGELEQYVLKHFVGFTDIINLVKDLTDPTPIMIRDIIRISEMTK